MASLLIVVYVSSRYTTNDGRATVACKWHGKYSFNDAESELKGRRDKNKAFVACAECGK